MVTMIDPYVQILVFCVLIIFSYFFNVIANRYKIPAVISLLVTGQVVRQVLEYYGIDYHINESVLEILGVVGLILIVLEASLDLKLTADKKVLIRKSLIAALVILIGTSVSIAYFFHQFFETPFINALVYAIALSVISSSIVIPSVLKLPESKKEFMIYESTFSDIIGILLFNFITLGGITDAVSIVSFGVEIILTTLASVVFAILLAFLIKRIQTRVRFFLVIAILVMVYALGKKFHLSPLILVLAFGVILNNMTLLLRTPLKSYIDIYTTQRVLNSFKPFIDESSFLIRTFFFLVFGFSLDIGDLISSPDTFIVGLVVITILYFLRYFNFKYFIRTSVLPEIFIAPRGLITILLYYSIPDRFQIAGFHDGILLFLILVTAILMMLALIFSKDENMLEEIHISNP